MSCARELPVAVFDSGVGGLTVLPELGAFADELAAADLARARPAA